MLSYYAMSSVPTEFERIGKLLKGFASYLQETITYFVLSGGSFQSIINHVRMIESIQHAKHSRQDGAKRFHCHG